MTRTFPDDVVELTSELVRTPSENPTGNEAAMSEYMVGWMEKVGMEVQILPGENKRANVIGRLRGAGESMPLVYMAHMDSVPIGERDKWNYDPFGAEIKNGYHYGRGACDMKGGTAAAMIAIQRIKDSGAKLRGDLVLACTVDEETTMKGISHIGRIHALDENAYLLAMEPTNCTLNVAHKGVYWFTIKMKGRGAHAANPQFGADANQAMAEAMLGWYELAEKIFPAKLKAHPLLGLPSLIVSKLQGGVKTNIVSEICNAEIDMRVPPIISSDEIISYLEEIGHKAAEKYGVSFELTTPTELRHPVECRPDSPLLKAFERAYTTVTGNAPEKQGFLAYTDAAMLAIITGNQHSTVFGPGALRDAHTTDEKVEISQLHTATDVLERTALELLG